MVREIAVKTILNKHRKRDDWFLDDYSINPYISCSFNCIYCYIRGSKYGENMAKTLSIKINAPKVLEKQLRRRAEKGEYGFIAISTSTEPYQAIEKKLKLTRNILRIILRYRFPVHILTKATLVMRDLDLLRKIDEKAVLPIDLKNRLNRGVIINFSISTLDEELAEILEPGAPKPMERLKTMQICKEKGFLTGISYIPTLPFISDTYDELDNMVKTAKNYGADFIFVGALTLFGDKPADSKVLYYKFLRKHYPKLLPKYKSLFKISPYPSKKYREKLEEKTREICVKYKINNRII